MWYFPRITEWCIKYLGFLILEDEKDRQDENEWDMV